MLELLLAALAWRSGVALWRGALAWRYCGVLRCSAPAEAT